MYNVPHFKAENQQEVMAFMRAHPFIILCGANGNGQPVATHVPVLFREGSDKLFLQAHVMKKQEHTEAFRENDKVLAVFYGPHTYVSASWYTHPQTASTWNYQAVHVKGILRFLDQAGLRDIITRLTENFENNPHSPALVQKMDNEYVEKMMQAIVAFEIEVLSIEHIFKLSQNRDPASYENIIRRLGQQDADGKAIAESMRARQDSSGQ